MKSNVFNLQSTHCLTMESKLYHGSPTKKSQQGHILFRTTYVLSTHSTGNVQHMVPLLELALFPLCYYHIHLLTKTALKSSSKQKPALSSEYMNVLCPPSSQLPFLCYCLLREINGQT